MSTAEAEQFITLARVAKTQGRHGEVACDLFTDFPERFAERRKLFAWRERGGYQELELEDFWMHKDRVVLKFTDVNSIDDAEKLIGAEIRIPASQRAELEQGAVYISELAGCAVIATMGAGEAREIGRVENVQFGAGEAPLLVIKQGEREHLVPFVESFVVRMDLAARRIEMRLPEGMLEPEKD